MGMFGGERCLRNLNGCGVLDMEEAPHALAGTDDRYTPTRVSSRWHLAIIAKLLCDAVADIGRSSPFVLVFALSGVLGRVR
jgi:hypothetical protein